ncbi:heat shock transcription factor, X-linked-like [Phalacrocorax carbo]|uniref:heat shock transcription factor, X-linked-like n=1 Tax=Phalacrocorax carbo TaxID=9209 RepID=UPI003119749C
MEPPSPAASRASDPQEPDSRAGSASPDHARGDTGTPWDAATGPLAEDGACQGLPDESRAAIIPRYFSKEVSAKSNQFAASLFIKKLWKIVGSHRFRSVWWGDSGNWVVIAERLFRREVLGRRGPLRLFETDSMRGFLLQLNLHGFCKMEADSPVSVSTEELRAAAAAGSDLGKLLFYYSPFVRRDYPNLLRLCAQSAAERERAPAAPPRGPRAREEHPRRRRPDARLAVGAEEAANTTHTAASPGSAPTEPRADTAAHAGSAAPSPPKRRRGHSPAGSREAAPAPPRLLHTLSHLLPRTVPSRQPWRSPPFHLGRQIQLLRRAPGLACLRPALPGFSRPYR